MYEWRKTIQQETGRNRIKNEVGGKKTLNKQTTNKGVGGVRGTGGDIYYPLRWDGMEDEIKARDNMMVRIASISFMAFPHRIEKEKAPHIPKTNQHTNNHTGAYLIDE